MRNKECGILLFSDADQEGIGNKARHLSRLMRCESALFSVPNGLVLLPEFSTEKHLETLLKMLPQIGVGPFAVRSCGLNEDGINESMAGKFHTELHVSPSQMLDAIVLVRSSFGDTLDTSAVLVQQMINPDFAGVMFTRSPENHGLASCEFVAGLADAVVSGTVEPERVDYGRWTGLLYPEQADLEEMLSLLFLVGMTIEDKMGSPQDIEWAYDKRKGQLYILQSRGITSQLYEASVAIEQEKIANCALRTKRAKKGLSVFENSAVREVVSAPTRLTRGLIEYLYAPSGSLGLALKLLNLPCPKVDQSYVLSIFGRLYANLEVEQRLFGFHPMRLWMNYRLKRKIINHPEPLLKWLEDKIHTFPSYPVEMDALDKNPIHQARGVMAGVKVFIEEVYPVAYAATFLAQIANEDDQQGSLTSQLISDLSRLHHTGDNTTFQKKWGLRSANDYELSEPRFCESADRAKAYASSYSSFSWNEIKIGTGFTSLKESAKDKAVRWLYPLRQNLLQLEAALGLEEKLIFHLDWSDIQALANGETTANDIVDICHLHGREVEQFKDIQLGDSIALKEIEQLERIEEGEQGLRGKMVSVRKRFQGRVRHVDTLIGKPLAQGDILLTQYLEPELVGLFNESVGCISDMGGALSHAAIVAREMNYPIVVLPNSSQVIQDGDTVEIDDNGRINLSRGSQVH